MAGVHHQPLFVSTTYSIAPPPYSPSAPQPQIRSPVGTSYHQPTYIPVEQSSSPYSQYSSPQSAFTAYSPSALVAPSPISRATEDANFFIPRVSLESNSSDEEKTDCAAARKIWASLPRAHRIVLIITVSILALMLIGFMLVWIATSTGGGYDYK